jgi:hypothetical protein
LTRRRVGLLLLRRIANERVRADKRRSLNLWQGEAVK